MVRDYPELRFRESNMEPDWLVWARRIQALAQTGIAYTRDAYDRGRYEALRTLAAEMLGARSGGDPARIEALFADQSGYATPKVDVRGAVFDRAGRILLVREVADAGRWTLPGGWADINQSPSECVAREVLEEVLRPRLEKLVAPIDGRAQGLMAGRQVARPAGEQCKAPLQALEEGRW